LTLRNRINHSSNGGPLSLPSEAHGSKSPSSLTKSDRRRTSEQQHPKPLKPPFAFIVAWFLSVDLQHLLPAERPAPNNPAFCGGAHSTHQDASMEETPLDAPSLRVTATLPHFQEWQPAFLITDINLLLHVATRATSPVYGRHSHLLGLLPIVPTAFQPFLFLFPVPTSKSGNLRRGPFA
jgi:hypothetical protein